jgi:cytochrome oxidase assembly protein ShyY1
MLLAVVSACVWLGLWQWDRARVEIVRSPPEGVAPLLDVHEPGQVVPEEQIGRRVVVRGSFDSAREVTVVDRQEAGRLGVWVVTAFRPSGSDGAALPVVRGWLPLGASVPAAPRGLQRIVGWLEPTEPEALRLRGREPLPSGQVELISSAELLSLWEPPLFQGFVIQQLPEPEPPLVGIESPALSMTAVVNWQNAAYGIQWWLFAIFAIFWFVRMIRVDAEDQAASAEAHNGASLDAADATGEIDT